jgi:hypothetical protein
MTITVTEGPNPGKTYPAFYDLKGDALRICYDLSGAKRPTEFKSVTGTQLYLVTYNRQKEQVSFPTDQSDRQLGGHALKSPPEISESAASHLPATPKPPKAKGSVSGGGIRCPNARNGLYSLPKLPGKTT